MLTTRWRFRAWPLAEHADLVDVLDATADERQRALPPAQACWLVEHVALRDPADEHRLGALLRQATGTDLAFVRGGNRLPLVEAALRSGRLLVVAKAYHPPVITRVEEPKEEPPLEFGQGLDPLDWIEVELTDARGEPIADEEYVLRMPDGTERRGRTDVQGSVRVDRIEGGTCVVRFPRIDAREIKPA